jgi:hypothetical protein
VRRRSLLIYQAECLRNSKAGQRNDALRAPQRQPTSEAPKERRDVVPTTELEMLRTFLLTAHRGAQGIASPGWPMIRGMRMLCSALRQGLSACRRSDV